MYIIEWGVKEMKISQLMYNTSADFENRKRALQRRETTEAYRKSAQYQSPKNPMLEALENLLSGKTEKDLHRADEELRNAENALNTEQLAEDVEKQESQLTKQEKLQQPEVRQEIRQLQMTEQEVIKHEQAHKSVGGDLTGPVSYTYTNGPDEKRYIDGGEVSIQAKEGATPEETLNILQRVRDAALAPADPSPQDLRVAASASSQMQQVRSEIANERYEEFTSDRQDEDPFKDIDLTANIPERFLNDFANRDASRQTVFGKELEKAIFNRTFNKATAKYQQHNAMVKNGYRSFEEPSFSKIA